MKFLAINTKSGEKVLINPNAIICMVQTDTSFSIRVDTGIVFDAVDTNIEQQLDNL